MKKAIWVIVLIILVIGAISLLLSTKAGNNYSLQYSPSPSINPSKTQTYINKKNGFQIAYPSDWTYRQYDSGSGIGFRPKNMPNDPQYEYISISVYPKPVNIASLPFDQYVKVAAINEIQNYQKLVSAKPFKTIDGQTGYITTWMVQPIGGGKPEESLPIAYLPANDTTKTTEAFLNDKKYMDVFTTMLSTFKNLENK